MSKRKYKKSYREMATEAGVSVGTIAKAVKVDELGRSQEVIDGKKTPDEILREEGLLKKNSAFTRCVDALKKLTIEELVSLESEIQAEIARREQ